MDPQNPNQPNNLGQQVPQPQTSATPWLRTLIIVLLVIFLLSTVGLGAYFLGKNQPKSAPIVQNSPIPTPDPTINWKTYTNSEYGFTFKYPPSWSYEIQKQTFSILKPGIKQASLFFGTPEYVDLIEGKVLKVPGNVTLNIVSYQDKVNSPIALTDINNLRPQWSDILVNNTPAKKVKHIGCQSGDCEDILITNRNIIIDFATQDGTISNLDQILSTFKLTD